MHTISDAVQAIAQKQCVVFPTETVYGLGANALCEESVSQIFKLKNRPASNPLIVHVADIDSIQSVATGLTNLEQKLFEYFSPGPLTLVLPKKNEVPSIVSGGLTSVGVRIPNHPIALELLKAVNTPLCAPSANISGKPSPTTFEMAKFYMEDKGVVILDGGNLDIGIESTVIKVEGDKILLLRAGSISPQMIADCCGILPTTSIEKAHHSPGTQFAHYKPKASIHLIVHGGTFPNIEGANLLCLTPPPLKNNYNRIYHFNSIQEYSHHLYDLFFQCDKDGVQNIICELPENTGEGMGLHDRLSRAGDSLLI